jgi:hypothetical protein
MLSGELMGKRRASAPFPVKPGLVPRIHVFDARTGREVVDAGTSPAMTA